jgi:hypothetical protein
MYSATQLHGQKNTIWCYLVSVLVSDKLSLVVTVFHSAKLFLLSYSFSTAPHHSSLDVTTSHRRKKLKINDYTIYRVVCNNMRLGRIKL